MIQMCQCASIPALLDKRKKMVFKKASREMVYDAGQERSCRNVADLLRHACAELRFLTIKAELHRRAVIKRLLVVRSSSVEFNTLLRHISAVLIDWDFPYITWLHASIQT